MRRSYLRIGSASLFALVVSFSPALGQLAAPRTGVVVVGTVHERTERFTEQTLVSILKRVKPDVVLLELDPSFFEGSAATLPLKYQGLTLETRAVTAYAREVPTLKVRPYDIEGRNKFYEENDYFSREMTFNLEIKRQYEAGQLGGQAMSIFEGLVALASVRDACGSERVEVINSMACDAAIDKKQNYSFQGLSRIVDLTPQLKDYKPFATLAADFWLRRNKAMVANIIAVSKELRPPTVLVLCGFEHRYYLRSSLREESPRAGFTVKEFLDFPVPASPRGVDPKAPPISRPGSTRKGVSP